MPRSRFCSSTQSVDAAKQHLYKILQGLSSVGDYSREIQGLMRVPREDFVPSSMRGLAYRDRPLPIGQDQTISQPSLVAQMTAGLRLRPSDRVLEVGTGCGYQTAILAELAAEVYTIEIREILAQSARQRLEALGYKNIHFKIGDGSLGWPKKAPFDGIIVTAAASKVPQALLDQLRVEAHLVIPVGSDADFQQLFVYKREGPDDWSSQVLMNVRFVPLVLES